MWRLIPLLILSACDAGVTHTPVGEDQDISNESLSDAPMSAYEAAVNTHQNNLDHLP